MPKIDRISYSELMPTSAYLNVRVGAEMSLDAGDDAMEAMRELKNFVHNFYQANYQPPPTYSGDEGLPEIQKKETQISEAVSSVLLDINESQTLKQLKSNWLISKGNLVLSQAYQAKLKQLEKI